MQRYWQNWDNNNVAQTIENYWQTSDAEHAHRGELVGLVARHKNPGHRTILEVGCGSGMIYERLVPAVVANDGYTGIDVSEKMLSIARRKFPNATFLHGDGYSLAFEDRTFDMVVSFEVLGHIPDIDRFVKELLRVTRRTCIFTVWPSHNNEIITNSEVIDGTSFLKRYYPESYMRRIIGEARPDNAAAIEITRFDDLRWAYILDLNSP